MFKENSKKRGAATVVFALVTLLAALLLAGCHASSDGLVVATKPNPTHFSSQPFFVVNEWIEEIPSPDHRFTTCTYIRHVIMVDPETKVMYYSSTTTCIGDTIFLDAVSTTFGVLLDADGTPRIYDGDSPLFHESPE